MNLLWQVKKLSVLLFYSLIILSITGCGEKDVSDLTLYIDKVKARPKTAIEPLPEQKVVEPFIFNPEGLRDPFRPIDGVEEDSAMQVAVSSGIRPDFARRKEELESYSLDTLRMVGTLTMAEILWGLVKASDGTIHRVQVGYYMGKNHGKIVQITEDSVELMEIVPGIKKGIWREQQASIALTK